MRTSTLEEYAATVVPTQDKPILIDFWASWCPPCRVMEPVVEKFADDNPNVIVLKIDIDANPEIAAHYGVASIPTFVSILDGAQEHKRIIGVTRDLKTLFDI